MIQLLLHILRKGKFRHTGSDFTEQRARTLAGFPEIFPPRTSVRNSLSKFQHPVVKMFVAEAAFVKASLKFRGSYLSISGKSLSYIRIPRSGSTAVCKAILLHKYPTLTNRPLSPLQVNHLADLHTDQTLPDQDMKFFTVVRNPFARLVSVYRQFFETNKPFLYEDYLFGVLKEQMSFPEFVSTVKLIPGLLKDQHLKPQETFLDYYWRNGKHVHILKLEDEANVKNFMASYGLMFENFNCSADPYDYSLYYDRDILKHVFDLYRADILRFNYGAAYDELRAFL